MGQKISGHEQPLAYARLTTPWKLRGLLGQKLGEVTNCALDLSSGRIVKVALTTEWQTVWIPISQIASSEEPCSLQLLAAHHSEGDKNV